MPLIEQCDEIKDVLIIHPDIHQDSRGLFIETYRRSWFPLGREMIQGNRGDRAAGSLVGLHYHLHQADYWYVPFGLCRIVLHDLREGSPTCGNTYVTEVGDKGTQFDHRGIFIPPGVAHGFLALTQMTITYMVDSYYNSNDELGVAWDDPAIKTYWGDDEKIISARDMSNPLISEIPEALRPTYGLRT